MFVKVQRQQGDMMYLAFNDIVAFSPSMFQVYMTSGIFFTLSKESFQKLFKQLSDSFELRD